MKAKTLLLSATMIASSVAAFAADDITPDRFKFAKQPEGQFKINYYRSGANPDNAFQPAFDGSDDGYLLVGGAKYLISQEGETPADPFTQWFEKSTEIVDLGGEVGKVLLIKGPQSNYEMGAANDEAVKIDWFNYNFYTPQSRTPISSTAGEHPIRMRLVFQIRSNNVSADALFKVSSSTWANNQVLGGENFSAADFALLDENGDPVYGGEDGFSMITDESKWQIFEFDCEVGDKAGNPTRMKLEFTAGVYTTGALLIKELSFVTDPTGEPVQREFVTYKPGETSSVKDLMKEAAYTVSGRQVTFATDAVVYGLNGAVVATAEAGETLSLTPGFYVVKANNEGSKLMIK